MSTLQLDQAISSGAGAAIASADSARAQALSILGNGVSIESSMAALRKGFEDYTAMKNDPNRQIKPPLEKTPEAANYWLNGGLYSSPKPDGSMTEIPPPSIDISAYGMTSAYSNMTGTTGAPVK